MSEKNVMCKFRFQRGGLEESMATCVEIHSKDELYEIINKELGELIKIQPKKIKFKKYLSDYRTGWKKQYLVVADGVGVIGYSDSKLK